MFYQIVTDLGKDIGQNVWYLDLGDGYTRA